MFAPRVCNSLAVKTSMLRPRHRLHLHRRYLLISQRLDPCAEAAQAYCSAGSFSGREATAPFVISGSYLDQAPVTWVSDRGGIRMTFS